MKNIFRTILLTLLLVLILIGMTDYWVTPASGLSHTSYESACVIHAGILLPNHSKSASSKLDFSLLPVPDLTTAWCLHEKISHPPTI